MPNIKSAKKRVLVIDKKRAQNRMILSEMKTAVKKFNLAISENNAEEAERLLPIASSAIDSAATKGVIHKNKANHAKSQIGKALSLLKNGVVVVKADVKTLKQAEQKAAAQRKAQEAEAIKQSRNTARKEREAAKAAEKAPAKKTAAKKATKKATKKSDDTVSE